MSTRRDFIKILSVSGLALPQLISARETTGQKREKLRFGICADVHKDIMHDADFRLKSFIEEAKGKDLDFIIQLGDFCVPKDQNLDFLSVWNSYPGTKYHVIGNHDTDGGFSREDVVKYWGLPGQYYSFDLKGYHFIVLDGNDEDPSPDRPSGYARFIGEEQANWLKRELEGTELPTIVFCHQGLDNDRGGIDNGPEIRQIFEQSGKVQLVFSGHHHQDYYNLINGIHYVQINSMSYQWLGEKYQHIRYSEDIDKEYPWSKYTVPYKDPIWAFAEIDVDNTFGLFGKQSEFVGPSPTELGMDEMEYGYPIVPYISNKSFKMKKT